MAGRLALLAFLCVSCLSAQTITGSITGSVKDSSGASVAGARVKLVQAATGAEREEATNGRGDFVVSNLPPGEYTLSVSQPGFKTVERKGLRLSASEILPADVVLEVGAVAETVTVTAQGAVVQTASAERAGLVSSSQVENLLIRSRTVMGLLSLLPGVVDQGGGSESIDRNWNLSVNGNRRNTVSVSLDGATLNALGNNFNAVIGVSQDAIAEVKVLQTNYQAEYGRMSGANVTLVSKSGTRQFHGLGSYFKRHEQFNANDFFNNRLTQPKARYRFNTWSYNVGGPVYIPEHFNRNRDKLFFFFSQEYWPLRAGQPLGQVTVPTELERNGDFSQSLDLNNRLISVVDPVTRQAFPGNRVPASRLDPNGQALLKFLPLPNFFDRNLSAGRYNYLFQTENQTPQRMETLKLDYNINSNNLLTANFSDYSDVEVGAVGAGTSGAVNWPQFRKKTTHNGKLLIVRYTRIFSPRLVNEMNAGFSDRPEIGSFEEKDLQRNQRKTVGFNTPQFHPESNPYSVVPNASFGGVTGAANLLIEGRFPLLTEHKIFSLTDNLTRTLTAHTVKVGFYADRFWRNASDTLEFNGAFDFGRNANNPIDTGYAYSNAVMGVFSAYTEASSRPFGYYRVSNIEWFAQDNWKVTRRLTLELGMRFSWIEPIFERDNRVSTFVLSRFDRARQVQLITPAMVDGRRVGINPVTKETYPAALIGAIAPGTGDPVNGLVVPASDKSYPRALIENRGIHFAPRFGFAFDPFGKGKTAIRGGFGFFYNRQNLSAVINPFAMQAPMVQRPVISFGYLSTLSSSSGLLSPGAILGIDRAGLTPTVMNSSFTIQQNVGWGTVLEAGYVTSLGRHLMWVRNLNSIPFGSTFDPKNADPTSTTNPKAALPGGFLRPMIGYTNINQRDWGSNSSYHSLQVQANRRFTRGAQFGASWTWSKAMGYNNNDTDAVSFLLPVKVWNYGLLQFDRTHVFSLNWLWDLPKAPWENPLVTRVLNGWQLSGITSFVSGQPLSVGLGTTVAVDTTGSPTDGARVVVTGNPVLPKSERTFSRNFRTEVFQMPAKGTVGNAANTVIRGPGINNWDVAIFKNFPLHGERTRLQFRAEFYNFFNHTQFSALDASTRFDPTTGAQTNARFGEFTASRTPRIGQLALRLYF